MISLEESTAETGRTPPEIALPSNHDIRLIPENSLQRSLPVLAIPV